MDTCLAAAGPSECTKDAAGTGPIEQSIKHWSDTIVRDTNSLNAIFDLIKFGIDARNRA